MRFSRTREVSFSAIQRGILHADRSFDLRISTLLPAYFHGRWLEFLLRYGCGIMVWCVERQKEPEEPWKFKGMSPRSAFALKQALELFEVVTSTFHQQRLHRQLPKFIHAGGASRTELSTSHGGHPSSHCGGFG